MSSKKVKFSQILACAFLSPKSGNSPLFYLSCACVWRNSATFCRVSASFCWMEIQNTSHKFWDWSHCPHYQCCLQVSETVSWDQRWCHYSANMLQHWVAGRDLIYFCKEDHSKYSDHCHKIWGSYVNKIGSLLIFGQFLENIWGTCSMNKCCDT